MTKETRARIRGKVESFSGGHGYIIGDDGAVYFAHYTEITDSKGDNDNDSEEEMPSLSAGATVEFQPDKEEDDEEPAALEIRVVTGD